MTFGTQPTHTRVALDLFVPADWSDDRKRTWADWNLYSRWAVLDRVTGRPAITFETVVT